MMWIIDGEERALKNMVSQLFLLVHCVSSPCMSVAFSESIDGTTGNKKLAMTVSIPSSQTVKKNKAAKRKLNSISGSSSAKVIF